MPILSPRLSTSRTCFRLVKICGVSLVASFAPTLIFDIPIGYIGWNTIASEETLLPVQILKTYSASKDPSLVFAHSFGLTNEISIATEFCVFQY